MDLEDISKTRRYIVLPASNNFNADADTSSIRFSRKLAHGFATKRLSGKSLVTTEGPFKVVDTVDGDQVSVVEMTEAQRLALSGEYPGLMIAPEGRLRLLWSQFYAARLKAASKPPKSNAKTLKIKVLDGKTPVAAADVLVVFDKTPMSGVSGIKTNSRGQVSIKLPQALTTIEEINVYPRHSSWPLTQTRIDVSQPLTEVRFATVPIVPAFEDGLARLVGPGQAADGAAVRIAIIDAGISPPPGMTLAYSLNTTGTEPADLTEDNGSGHGTHVAGVVLRLAPAAEIYNYRVFMQDADEAREADIARAIRDAVDNDCDLINLSLGQEYEPIAIIREIRRARSLGALCIAAAGNDFNGPVNYPARSTHVQAISACGHLKAWPAGTAMAFDVDDDPKPIGDVYFAAFSNRGAEVDFMMPGSGIVSPVNSTQTGVMSGTSMASPAATGIIARLLSKNARVRDMTKDQQRSDEIAKMASAAATQIGFGAHFEGRGAID